MGVVVVVVATVALAGCGVRMGAVAVGTVTAGAEAWDETDRWICRGMGVAAGDGPTAYMPFSSSTTGPSTMQISHTRCKPLWPVVVYHERKERRRAASSGRKLGYNHAHVVL